MSFRKALNILVVYFLFGSTPLFSQEKPRHAFFELFGSGGFGSFNYEKVFHQKEISTYSWRVGFSIAPIDKNNGAGLVFPIMIHGWYGKTSHKIEWGFGQGITITTKGSFFAMAIPSIGYRFQKDDQKLFFRATYTPLVSYLWDFQVQHWVGLSLGIVLKSKK